MSRRRWRGTPALTAKPFSDWAPDTPEPSFSPGALISGATEGAPGSLVHRSFDRLFNMADLYAGDDAALLRRLHVGYGATSPMQAPVRRSPLVRVGTGPARTQVNRRSTLYKPAVSSSWRALNVLQVRAPSKEVFCVRRRMRKGVLFARGIAGARRRSPGRGGTYHRNTWSQWRC